MERGDIFGEIALLDGLSRTANATAIEETLLIVIDRSHFLGLLEREPGIARHIIELLCERLRDDGPVLRRRVSQPQGSFGQTFAGVDDRPRPEMPGRHAHRSEAPQTDLANMVGVTREAVNKQLGNWTHRGIIQHTRGTVIVCDQQALKLEASAGTV